MAAGGDTFIDHLMGLAGFRNAVGYRDRYPELSISELKDLSPDLLFLSSEPFPFKEEHIPFFQEHLTNTKIILVDGTYFSWYGSRLKDAAEYFDQLNKNIPN